MSRLRDIGLYGAKSAIADFDVRDAPLRALLTMRPRECVQWRVGISHLRPNMWKRGMSGAAHLLRWHWRRAFGYASLAASVGRAGGGGPRKKDRTRRILTRGDRCHFCAIRNTRRSPRPTSAADRRGSRPLLSGRGLPMQHRVGEDARLAAAENDKVMRRIAELQPGQGGARRRAPANGRSSASPSPRRRCWPSSPGSPSPTSSITASRTPTAPSRSICRSSIATRPRPSRRSSSRR